MIDFCKELTKFDFAADDREFTGYYNETAPLVEAFTATLKRIGRELNSTHIQLEEVLSQLDEETEREKQIAALKKTIAAVEAEKSSLLLGLVATLDQLEHIYRYAMQNARGSWSEQLQLLWENTAANLLPLGLIRIEGENTLFDARIHVAAQVQEDINVQNSMVLEVLQSGYIYQSHLLRKARVVVNKTDGGDEYNGQHCGY
jgi:molecular chaperone GrpE